ncbi:protease HtpX [Basilea psittacipulmonis]|uniref:Protease HtpX homolog n=1 Tax=Basilea psittacipulmonis DSM 24701 TaxID=1072685 RepID=A0A077DDI5_9BURK|nr:protease HtpX [Basilea psittacipulmonis]AIL32935.1 heat shock protein HtpX [Basilea psittacipulmonis DSM 24701]
MTRIFLFVMTNIAVVALLSLIINILGLNYYLEANGINYLMLLGFALIFGFGGSFISLLMSKTMAKASVGAKVIDPNNPANQTERWLVSVVYDLADKAKIGRPEVAIYQGAPNAFATGAFKDKSLVAVSTGLLESMTKEEVTAVLGHEVAHVANGDMVTSALLQGVLNTFVIFLSRVIAQIVSVALQSKNQQSDEEQSGSSLGMGMSYYMVSMVLEMVFGVFASIIVAWFSRYREYRADAGSAHLLGSTTPMIHALERLGGISSSTKNTLPASLNAFGITGGLLSNLFASHPPIAKRIEALKSVR